MAVLDGVSIVLAGTFSGRTHGSITKMVEKLGGKVTKDITDNTTHLVTVAGAKNGKITTARSRPTISIVSIDWLDECENTKKFAKKDNFLVKFDDDASEHADGVVTVEVPASRRSARTAAAVSQNSQTGSSAPAPAAPPALKRSRSVKKEKTASPEPETDGPAAKKRRGRAAAKAKKDDDVDMKDADSATTTGKGAKGKGKGKAEVAEDKAPNIKTAIARKGTAPVDEFFVEKDSYHVYTDDHGTIYDGALNQTQINANANKFYYVQLLRHNTNANLFATFTRWGRVGESGQKKIVAGPGCSLHEAMREFESKFRSKSGLSWANRRDEPKNGKYTYIEKSYEEDSADEDADAKTNSDSEQKDGPVVKVESKLAPSLQKLMELIFNLGYINASMVEMNYDANKLPLGKLSKETLKRGYEVLKAIGDALNSSASPYGPQFLELSNRFYSIIPHAFGRGRPPTINSPQALKREAELLDALGDLGIANNIIKATKGPVDEDGNPIHQLDARFRSLNLNTAEPLAHDSREFQLLSDYLKKTHGKTHYIRLEIEDIFRIVRPGESERWSAAGWDDYTQSQRLLLWHGSRTTNFGGILSQGLRIAPPEAPATGTMFGKGIYLADMVTKSANYCCHQTSGNTGLLLLCEAQVGNPMHELFNADYKADIGCHAAGKVATKGLGRTVPKGWMEASELGDWAKGVYMPDVTRPTNDATGDSGLQQAYLQYNEYIVYDLSQVQIRYLFRCKFY